MHRADDASFSAVNVLLMLDAHLRPINVFVSCPSVVVDKAPTLEMLAENGSNCIGTSVIDIVHDRLVDGIIFLLFLPDAEDPLLSAINVRLILVKNVACLVTPQCLIDLDSAFEFYLFLASLHDCAHLLSQP